LIHYAAELKLFSKIYSANHSNKIGNKIGQFKDAEKCQAGHLCGPKVAHLK